MTIHNARLSRTTVPPATILPGDPGYDEARITFNGMLDRRPAAIVPCASTGDVVAAVRAARAAGLPIAIRGGGHSVAGHCIPDDALVVSLAAMRTVSVDPDRRRADAGGGALWDDVDAAAFAHGLAVPGGTFGDTGIGGLTLGGGIGWLMPVAGLTCDNLVEAEVVTADGSVVIAGPAGDDELLWALRGGGGNFGIVTRFTYRLTPIGPMWGGAIVFLAGVVDGSDPLPIAAALRRDLPVLADDLGPRTYLELQTQAGTLPFGLRHYWKGHFLRELDGDTFVALAEAVSAPDAVGSAFILIEGMVGAGRDEPAGGAAFGQRAAHWNASALAIWERPEHDATAIAWSRRVVDLLAPSSLTGGGYVNYAPVDETTERVIATYGPDRWERLVAVKRRYDPDNAFRFNHNIAPG